MEIAGLQVGAVGRGGGDGELPIGSAASDLCKLLPHEDGHCPATEYPLLTKGHVCDS